MKNGRSLLSDGLFASLTLLAAFWANLFLVERFDARTVTPMVFGL